MHPYARSPCLLVLAMILVGCATAPPADETHHIVRIKTCLASMTPFDPGPIDGQRTPQLEAALQAYIAQFAQDDVMAMGRDPQGQEVRTAAFKALLYGCWKQGKLPPGDPMANVPETALK